MINNSSATQSFVAGWGADFGSPTINFQGSAAAGNNTSYTIQGGTASEYQRRCAAVFDSSTAAEGIFVVQGSTITEAGAGHLSFFGNSTAANGQFQVETGANGGTLDFCSDDSNAGVASFAVDSLVVFFGNACRISRLCCERLAASDAGAGFVLLNGTTSADDASFTGTGGAVQFAAGSTIYFSVNSDAANATLAAYRR